MIITPFDFCRAASTLHGDMEGEDLDISLPKSVPVRAFCLENALMGQWWTRPTLEKVWGARNAQHIRSLEGQRKKDERHAVYNDGLRELVLRTACLREQHIEDWIKLVVSP